MVGVLLAGEVHLFTAEIFHHHADVANVCQALHEGGHYWHVATDPAILCPICQIMSSGSVRPAVPSSFEKPQGQSHLLYIAPQDCYRFSLAPSLLARAPPLA